MSRPRIHDTKLPAYVRIKSGSYYYKELKLSRVSDGEAAMYQALAQRKQAAPIDAVPVAVESFIQTELGELYG